MSRRFLSVSQAAARADKSDPTIRSLFDSGAIGGVRLESGERLIDPVSLDAFVQQDHLSVSRAARALGVSRETIRSWFDEGKLTGYRTEAGHRRIDPASIAAIPARV